MSNIDSSSPATPRLTREAAMAKAKAVLGQMKQEHGFVLQEDKIIDKPYGWVFFYTTRKYRETGDRKWLVPGTAPFIIELNGDVVFLTSSGPPSMVIADWEKKSREKAGK